MTRDGEMATTDWLRLVLANIGQETDAWGVTRIPASTALAVNAYSAPANRAALRAEWEQGLRGLLMAAEAGSDHQLTFARSYAAAAHSDAALDEVAGLLDGSFTVAGLTVDQDLRWALLTGLARAGRVGDAEIDAELASDNTISGQEHAAAARVAQPVAEAKAAGWQAIMDPATPNETSRSMVLSFMRYDQDEVLAPYLEKYLEAAETALDTLGFHKGSVVLEYGFPKALASPALLERVDAWLEECSAPKGAKRYAAEGRAEGDSRVYAQRLHATLVAPVRSLLLLVDPQARAIEVVTGAEVRRHLTDREVELAILEMQSAFAADDFVGGLKRGISMLAEHARPQHTLHAE
jgi:aminopeptidase N